MPPFSGIPDKKTRDVLTRVARTAGTPCYVYFLDGILERIAAVRDAFGGRFELSYAMKANPNRELLRRLIGAVSTLDVSSIGEVRLAIEAGWEVEQLSFSGPAKRMEELEEAVDLGVGVMICESLREMEQLDRLAAGGARRMSVCVRINPARCPPRFGVNMAGRASQFGIDEEDLPEVLTHLGSLSHIDVRGFHIYSATNSLSEEAIAENFDIFIKLFNRFGEMMDSDVKSLIFGAGFGIPYTQDAKPLDLQHLAGLINPRIDAMKNLERLAGACCSLELGRYLVGPEGFLLTTIIGEKSSRGTDIRMCDAGFNTHLAAYGMMGTVIRRNWPMWKVNATDAEPVREYMLTGPLCTTIDTLAMKIQLPELSRGDLLAIGSSGAYGMSASPTRFISHPEPREILVVGQGSEIELIDVTQPRSHTDANQLDASSLISSQGGQT